MSDQSDRAVEKQYESLSPFELKNKLIEMAKSDSERLMLNAGRGNPNWVALAPRHAFFEFGRFALAESERELIQDEFGGAPRADGIVSRFETFLANGAESDAGRDLLSSALEYATAELGLDAEALLIEFADAILGDHYPVPDRMLANCERIVDTYLAAEMAGGRWPTGNFDLFATEGGTAAITYVFNSLMENKLLHKGDKIALGTPIFTPYLEIPLLNDFEFVELEVEQREEAGWRYPASEIEKLADPDVRSFFVVNPANPSSETMHPETLEAIGNLVKERRNDLILLTDDVYGTFVDDFRSLAAVAPHNTILVYSFSKYFGATGWRLGVIGLHQDNILDHALQGNGPRALNESDRDKLVERYQRVFTDAPGAKLIDRMVADSREVALHHTAGLSTPQQVMMALFALASLTDTERGYNEAARGIVATRIGLLYSALGVDHPGDPMNTNYYATIDVPNLAEERYGPVFRHWLVNAHEPIDFVWRLAGEKGVILMDGGGFDAPKMSVRVSLANLADDAYSAIGHGISDLLAEYHDRWQSAQGGQET